jgi:hypothetical protein
MKLKAVSSSNLSIFLVFVAMMGNLHVQSQCDSIIGLPMDMVVSNDTDSCNAVVSWTEPTYSARYKDFTGVLTLTNWVLIDNDLNESGDTIILNEPGNITLIGASTGTGNMETDYCLDMPFDVNISFDWIASMQGGTFNNDEPAVVIGAIVTELQSDSGANFEMGRDTFFVPKDSTFCFRVKSDNTAFNTTFEIDSLEFEITEINQVVGNANGSTFELGVINTIGYEIVDSAMMKDTCTFTVRVEDREAPKINCISDITVELMPGQCDTLLILNDPKATDNCDTVEITQIDTTGLTSGSDFPIGLTELIYVAADTSVNSANDTCNVLIQVNEYKVQELGCEVVNLSLDHVTCSGAVSLGELTDGSEIGCPDSVKITITDLLGVPHANLFGPADINKTFEYTIETGGNSCRNTITIEDKVKPYIMVCEDDTISCNDDMSVAKEPIAFDNCGADMVLLEAPYTKLDCDSLFVGKYIRKYIAIDIAGNESEDTCTQVVYVKRTDFSGIKRPSPVMGRKVMHCDEFTPLANGAPSPIDAGVPTLNGKDLYPFDPGDICNGFGKFEDVITFRTNCKTQITRTWTFGEWHCDSIKRVSFLQMLEVVDNKGPELTVPKDFTVNVDGKNCEATVILDSVAYTDNCSGIKEVFVTTGSGDIINANGGLASLPVGENTIVYTVRDSCNNLSKDSMMIVVQENQEPIAVCETYTTVSLDRNGVAWLSATSIDDGSFDECDDYVDLEIARMDDPCNMNGLEFSDQVAFCCADAEDLTNPMVFLRVSDQKGNSNSCMVEVEVQDKNKPRITCPKDTVVTCDFTYDPLYLDIAFNPVLLSGTPCTGSAKLSDIITSNTLDQCRIGQLTRNITVEFRGEIIGECVQRIDFIQDDPISEGLIDWPDDITITDMCSMLDLEPVNLPDNADTPDVPDGGCNLVGVTKEDKTYPFAGNGACFKILRTWSVIDWCARNGSIADTIPEFTHVQTIYVQNLDAPQITSSEDTIYVESLSSDCSTIPVTLTASATDVCTPVNELQWSYVVNLEDGREIAGTGNDASGPYPEGTHRVDFTVFDRCGNSNVTGYVFEVITKTEPVMICFNKLSTSLVLMDTSSNGQGPAVALSMLTPEMFNNDSYHPCFDTDELEFSFDTLPGDTLLTLDCSNLLSDTVVNMYGIDPNGSYNFCKVTISVLDTLEHCNLRVGLVGRVVTQDDRNIMDAEVHLMSDEDNIDMTDMQGAFVFPDMPVGGEYILKPNKDGDDMNGVSTLDLIMIQRHILGIQELTNPYALIAADINNDQKISTTDLVTLRKLILGVYQEFPENTSWRFIDAGYIFPDPEDPWMEGFNEDYYIDKLVSDMQINFTGTKIGDVNNSAAVNVRSEAVDSRSNTSAILTVDNKSVKAGDIVDITFSIQDEAIIEGLQLGISMEGLNILDIRRENLDINESVSYIINGGIRISYDHKNREVIPSTASLFTITVQAKFDGMLSEMINFNEEQFRAEIYDQDLRIINVELSWNQDNPYQQFEVTQNQPNPWQNATTIDVNLPKEGEIKFSIFDISGKVLYQNNMNLKAGINKINLTQDMLLSSGVMFYEVEYDNEVIRKKMFNVR